MEPSRIGLTTPAELSAMKRELSEAAEPKSISKEKLVFGLKIILKVLLNLIAVSALLFFLMLSFAIRDGGSPSVFGYSLRQIKGEHMSPSIPSGGIVIVRTASTAKEGAIVIYSDAEGTRFAARILRKSQSSGGIEEYTASFDNSSSFPDPIKFTSDKIESEILFKIPFPSQG